MGSYFNSFAGIPLSRLLLCMCLFYALVKPVSAFQQYTATGKVYDESGKRPLAGVSVILKGTSLSVTSDKFGNFSIVVPQTGSLLTFSHLGYQLLETEAKKGMVVTLKPISTMLDEVSINVSKRVNTEIAVLDERRRAGIVQDGISAQQIERTASITTTQALQRVVGVTVTDDKYVAIRGLGDRSVIGQLNGVRLASSNPDRSAIPLDLVPATLLDNITVYKTFTPDKPADAAAGIVELKTKSVPDTLIFEVVAESGFNSNVGLGGEYNGFLNDGMGFWGTRINDKNLSEDFLALSAQYPNGLSSIQQLAASSNFSPESRQEVVRINGIMQGFDQTLTTRYKSASPNQMYSVTFGNSYPVFKQHKLGVILSGNYYRRTTDIYQGELTQWSVYHGVVTGNPDVYSWRNIPNYITPNNLNLGKYQTYKENTGNETLNYGVLAGLAYRFSPLHQIGGQFMGSWGGENTASSMDGAYEYSGLPGNVYSRVYSLKQTYRTLYTFNLQGEHRFLPGDYSPQLSYSGASSRSTHNDPDYRFASLVDFVPGDPDWEWYTRPRVTNQHDEDEWYTTERVHSEHLYALTSGYVNGYGPYGVIQAEPNGRRWRHLEEKNYNYKADLSFPFPWLGSRQEVKMGGNYLFRRRTYTENQLFLPGSNFSDLKSIPLYDVYGDLDRLVSSEVVGIKLDESGANGEGSMQGGGFLYNIQKSPNNYRGSYETKALYAMLDVRPAKQWRVMGGVRFESTDLRSVVDTADVYLDPSLTTATADGSRLPLLLIEPNSLYHTGYKPFYSVNLTYSLKEDMNVRAAYNTTLARPELREVTNVFEYDAFQMALVVGNPALKNQTAQNLDFRWEWFPTAGEVLAVSAFGKRIKNQLVKTFSLRTQGLAATYPEFPTIQFTNEPNIGKVWGMEFEFVKELGALWDPLRNCFLGSNLLIAQSDIKKSNSRYLANMTLDRNTPTTSPLFEQAPYSINAWLNYANKAWGSDFTATFNMVGERLVQINLLGEPDLYSRPVPMLDVVWSQRILKRLVFKGFVKNLLDPAIKTVYANPETGGKWYGKEYIQRSYKRGMELMVGFTYNVF
ncbi:TonB-dependent receptor [bacterium A37T11]|nr:TonB-dependent receptor [bacterium A37T11]